MRRAAFVIGGVLLLGLGWLFVRYQSTGAKLEVGSERSLAEADGHRPKPESAASPPDSSAGKQEGSVAARSLSGPNYESGFKSSRDMWQFAESIYPAASIGEPAAQFYLSRALRYCGEGYRFYFNRGSRRRTLDEAMLWASTRPGTSADEAKEIYEKCKRLEETTHPFGKAEDWLSKSKNGSYPLAMVESAQLLANTAGVSGQTENVEMRNEAKRLALEALRSKDPGVIFGIGDLAALFVGDLKKASQEQWVWRLAACKRGFDCSQNAEWYRLQCRFDANCQPYESGIDYIRRANSEHFDEIDQLANDLNAKLDANDFELFGS